MVLDQKIEIMENEILQAIRNRRSILRFESTPIEDEKLEAILEAGRWAPSWTNRQPWSFIVIKDPNTKNKLSEVVPTTFVQGLKEAPLCIAVVVNTADDAYHYAEDGANATQNMALAAYSLGLGTAWIGVYDRTDEKSSAEAAVRKILDVPKEVRVISIVPVGKLKGDPPKKDRKSLRQIVYQEKFGKR